jgi:hypothetical protein
MSPVLLGVCSKGYFAAALASSPAALLPLPSSAAARSSFHCTPFARERSGHKGRVGASGLQVLSGLPAPTELPPRSKYLYKTSLQSRLPSHIRPLPPLYSARSSTSFRASSPKSDRSVNRIYRRLLSDVSTMERNGEARAKRKLTPVTASDRPAKHLKPETSTLTPGDATPANGTVYNIEEDEETAPVLSVGATQADSPEWQATIESVVKSVVSIHFCQTCSFDTELSMSSQATGFVVDAERGYILTNRHVVCAGPFWGYCIFDNHEEVGFLWPYRRSPLLI